MLNSHTWQNRSRVYSVCNAESHMWCILILFEQSLSVHVRTYSVLLARMRSGKGWG